jgi:hypothetical protein
MSRLVIVPLVAACAAKPPAPNEPSSTRAVSADSIEMVDPTGPAWPTRMSGNETIAPDEATIERASVANARLTTTWKLCVDASGTVTTVDNRQSSGFPDYDAAVRRELLGWKYKPRDGAREICKAVTLVFELPTK